MAMSGWSTWWTKELNCEALDEQRNSTRDEEEIEGWSNDH